MKRGRPFEPGNKFGRGRPKGSRNKSTLMLQQLLDEHAPALMRKSLVLALQGSIPLLRMLLSAKLPRPLDPPVKIGCLPLRTIDDLLQAHQTVMHKVASGVVTPTQALQINALLETHRQLIETQDLATRISALEQVYTPHYRSLLHVGWPFTPNCPKFRLHRCLRQPESPFVRNVRE